jgi:uncharacterized protein (TIGR03067 family)
MTARTLSATGLAVLMLIVSAPAARADHMDKMQGTWKVVKGSKVGEKAVPDGMTVVIEKDKFTLKEPGKTEVVHFVLDMPAKPHGVEFFKASDKKEKVWHGIYKFEGDSKIVLSWGPAGKKRPHEFEPRKDSEDRLYILEKK